MSKLSVIVPCYNEQGVTSLFYKEAIQYIRKCTNDYEIVFVNDGSKDNTLSELLDLKKIDKKITILDFSRNFGKESAMLAGLREASGDLIVLMDADLQDPPSLLPEMFKSVDSGVCDCVATRRVDRKGEPPIRSFFARQFYKLINKMIEVEIVDGARDFRMMTRQMVDSILELTEYNRFSKGIFAWVGYNTQYLEFENVERVAGETKWSFFKLFKYAIEGIVAFTTTPLRLSTIVGALFFVGGFIWTICLIIIAIARHEVLVNLYFVLAIAILLVGIILLAIGVIGEYLAKTYTEVKCRPHFFIRKKY